MSNSDSSSLKAPASPASIGPPPPSSPSWPDGASVELDDDPRPAWFDAVEVPLTRLLLDEPFARGAVGDPNHALKSEDEEKRSGWTKLRSDQSSVRSF